MKRKDIKALHTKSADELKKELLGVGSQLSKALLERSVKPQKNTRIARTLKNEIAQIMTVLAEIKNKGAKKA